MYVFQSLCSANLFISLELISYPIREGASLVAGEESVCHAGDLASVPGLGRSLGGGHDNPLWYSCLENPSGRKSLAGSWGHKESDITERQSTATKKGP